MQMLDMIKDFVRAALAGIPDHVPPGYRPYWIPESCAFDTFEIREGRSGELCVFFPKNGFGYNEVSLSERIYRANEAGGDYHYSIQAFNALYAAKRSMQPK